MGAKITTEDFIRRAIVLHGDKYDYSEVVYVRSDVKVKIKCPTHGLFEQAATSHLSGAGCAACAIQASADRQRMTTAEFITKAREAHGDSYDYSETTYTRAMNKLKIICPSHGPFEQVAISHTRGANCPKCALETHAEWAAGRINDGDAFIEQCRQKHDGRYDYSKAVYTGTANKMTIICPDHGEFQQIAGQHRDGVKCAKCVGRSPLTLSDFIERARLVHGDKFDYSETGFSKMSEPVNVNCSTHGPFSIKPFYHLDGVGCKACWDDRRRQLGQDKRDRASQKFIERARVIHGDKYDYSQVDYRDSKAYVTIICPEHGPWRQIPNNHLTGFGCRKCAERARGDERKGIFGFTQEEVIARANEAHDGRYDYSRAVYQGMNETMEVICPLDGHGSFFPIVANHVGSAVKLGTGCPRCNASKGEMLTERWLKTNCVAFEREKRIEVRLSKVGRFLSCDFVVEAQKVIIEYDGEQHYKPVVWKKMTLAAAEAVLKRTQQRDRQKNEWAAASGYTMIRIPYWEDVDAYLNEHLLPLIRPAQAAE